MGLLQERAGTAYWLPAATKPNRFLFEWRAKFLKATTVLHYKVKQNILASRITLSICDLINDAKPCAVQIKQEHSCMVIYVHPKRTVTWCQFLWLLLKTQSLYGIHRCTMLHLLNTRGLQGITGKCHDNLGTHKGSLFWSFWQRCKRISSRELTHDSISRPSDRRSFLSNLEYVYIYNVYIYINWY